MHAETKTPLKEMVQLDLEKPSCLEEDLAISSSTNGVFDSSAEKTITETEEKTHDDSVQENTTVNSLTTTSESDQPPPIYVSEDAMDCNYDEPLNPSNVSSTLPKPTFELVVEDAPSPELFESDADDEAESTTSTYPTTLEEPPISLPSPKKYTPAELIIRADKFIQRRINKFLSGVPPPPSHTISQKDCDDFLVYIKQNRQYFWADPFGNDKNDSLEALTSCPIKESTEEKNPITNNINNINKCISTNTNTSSASNVSQSTKPGLRNLSSAFDECEQNSSFRLASRNSSFAIDAEDTTSSFSISDTLCNSSILSSSTFAGFSEDSKVNESFDKDKVPSMYTSITPEEVAKLSWPDVYQHRCQEIYYNRNKSTEEFENLRLKLCDRYIGAETQSTCNIWFAKQAPGSARKRSILTKRNNGQSPGKRLSYLAKRRRTFSSANLQGLGLAEKKQLMLNVRKGLVRKGKSPRGKSPRKKTPRSSAKKRHLRRLMLEGPSPRKTKIETSKRALFQSPPTDKPGPSRVVATTSSSATNNPQKIKRALFPTPKKNEDTESTPSLSYPESRKRKSEEELESSRHKWAKSLSFDCTRNLDNSSTNTWTTVRHSTGNVLTKEGNSNLGKCELSETHRKKLLWAVAEALRSKGIGMSHPMFKQYASTLARTVRKYMPDLENKNLPRKPGSTSDRMLKLAKRHVLLITDVKTA